MISSHAYSSTGADAYQRYLAALLAGDRQTCRRIFEAWLEASSDLRSVYEDLIQRSLYEIGDLWEQGQISVATEHLATAISEGLLNLVHPRLFALPRNGKAAVVACVADEHHQIGSKIVADFFELHGWRGYFLGANTPLDDVCALIGEKKPAVVALSLTVSSGLDRLLQTAAEIRRAAPQVPILAGGQAFRRGGREQVEKLEGTRCLDSLQHLETWLGERN